MPQAQAPLGESELAQVFSSHPQFCQDKLGRFQTPPLVFGAATLSHHYNDVDSFLHSDVPLRVVRLALRCVLRPFKFAENYNFSNRYGISAFDTSPYYGSSEVVLGQILRALEPEFPRSSYKLVSARLLYIYRYSPCR